MRHDWPVKNTIVDLPIRSKENSKRISGNSLSLLKAMNKGAAAASQTLLTRARLTSTTQTIQKLTLPTLNLI